MPKQGEEAMMPVAFVPLGALVVLDCGCAAIRWTGGPNGEVRVQTIRPCGEPHQDEDQGRLLWPGELVRPYGLSKA